jgi:hypothetical protein
MSEFNLVPDDYAREQAVRRRLRQALIVLAAAVCVLTLGRALLGVLIAGERQQLVQLQVKKKLWQENKAQTEKHLAEAAATEKLLAALDELRGREHLRLLLEAVDAAHLDKVWFDEIRYYRRDPPPVPAPAAVRTSGAAPAPKVLPAAPPRVEQRVGMVGHATNHVMLAEFMRRLEGQPGVAELSLLDTSPRTYPHALIIDFKLGLLMNKKGKGLP